MTDLAVALFESDASSPNVTMGQAMEKPAATS